MASSLQMTRNGFIINGEPTILRGGSVQWFRLPEEVWEDRLKKFKAAGFNTVGMYIAWNQIEKEPGVFNFEKPNIRRFLQLAKDIGLYVAVRPGPYITNEMDGGGLPAWLTKKSTKLSYERDGLVNLRSHDPDFMDPVRRYFTALNKVLKPYLINNGGPIVLYAVENEYTWFERGFPLDKLFIEGGRFERPIFQELPTKPYFQELLSAVRDTGIDVPVISCPGDGRASAMGDVKGIVPFPSMYEWANPGQPDQIAYELLEDMHTPGNHDDAYANVPGGSLEVNRSPTEFRRLIAGGLDGVFGFNMVGIIQEGYMNALTLAARAFDVEPHWGSDSEKAPPWLNTIFKFDRFDRILTGFVSPDLGYFNNVIDYHGAVSPSGVMRDIFYQFRRDNMSYDLFQKYIAALERPEVSGPAGSDDRLRVDHMAIGSRTDQGMAHYWFENDDFSLVQLVNQSGEDQTLDLGSIHFKGESYPKFETLLLANAREPKLSYAHNMPFNYRINDEIKLSYTSSEILTQRSFNDETLLVLYGVKGARGELILDSELDWKVVKKGSKFEKVGDLSFVYSYLDFDQLVLENKKGERLRVIVTNRFLAGRVWFREHKGHDLLILGPNYLEESSTEALSYQYDDRDTPIIVVAPEGETLSGVDLDLKDYDDDEIHTFRNHAPVSLKELPKLDVGLSVTDHEEVNLNYDDSHWLTWTGEPRNLEDLGIYQGHSWYRSRFTVDLRKNRGLDKLYVESASDIVGIYVNGQYLSTVSPIGTEINNRSWNRQYRFEGLKKHLKDGENIIVFRTEIWGHGSFTFGKGTVIGTKARIPALGYEGVKGLSGKAKIGNIKLENWAVRKDLTGELAGYGEAALDDRHWQVDAIPMQLDKGDVRWYRSRFETSELNSHDDVVVPIVLQLKGRSIKATIFVNGRLIGRWLSDSEWLGRGTWVTVQRAMWVQVDPDHFPIPHELLYQDGRDNVVSIALEDSSHSSEDAGQLDDLSLHYNNEQFQWKAGQVVQVPGVSYLGEFTISD